MSIKGIPKYSLLIALLTITALSLFTFVQFNGQKLDIDSNRIDMSNVEIPKEFSCDWYDATLEWEYIEVLDEGWLEYYTANSSDSVRAFQWSEELEGGVIHLAIVDYKYPIIATTNYLLLDPAGRKKEHYPNFENGIELVLTNRTWVNSIADQEAFQCGNGTEDKCYGWFYRARYGQYYLQIEEYGPTCYQYFEQVVGAINNIFFESLHHKK